jgi:hypothetical protein
MRGREREEREKWEVQKALGIIGFWFCPYVENRRNRCYGEEYSRSASGR